MIELIKTYIATLVVLVGVDGVWLGLITKNFYQKHLGYIFTDQVAWWAVGVFYPLYAFGILVFVLIPSLEAKSLGMALWRGALLGLVAYGAYDLTNQATLAKWPVVITLADLAWGIALTAIVNAIIYSIFK